MATAEQAGFSIPPVEERDDLLLAGVNGVTHQAGRIAAAADRAAQTAHRVLGVDKQQAEDTFTGQLETMDAILTNDVVPVAFVTVGAADEESRIWTPSHVIKGHDALTAKDGQSVPETYAWPKMYANRTAQWWNKTRPESEGESELIEVPLQIVLADVALRGTTKKWDEQQAELTTLIKRGNNLEGGFTVEGMPILAWPMMDADAIIHGTERPDDNSTATRFVQHEMDRVDVDVSCGPGAYVRGRKAYLGWSRDGADSRIGFRRVMGQKQQAS